MSNCPINGRAINTLYPINGCLGAVLKPPEYEPIGCYYLIPPECRDYSVDGGCQAYTVSTCGQQTYTISSCGCRPSSMN